MLTKRINMYKTFYVLPVFNPLSAKFIKWSNTVTQIVGKLPTICLSVFDHFSGLAFKGLTTTSTKTQKHLQSDLWIVLSLLVENKIQILR